MPLRALINRAFNTSNNDAVVGLPAFASTDRYDITAKVATGGPSVAPLDMDSVAAPMLALLKDRFKMTYHTEDRPVSAYLLVAGKPKMKKADPASRTSCKRPNAPAGAPPGSRLLVCQNVTMAQFAEQLQNLTPDLSWPVQDATGIEGGWDFTLTFTFNFGQPMMTGGPPRGGEGSPVAGGLPAASEPTDGLTLFEAVEKQLGLKLEKQKRTLPVMVIDHIEQKPTEN
jgi:uncharacterized protein (TIGR03435 family)